MTIISTMTRDILFSVKIKAGNYNFFQKEKVDICETEKHQTSFLFWLHKTEKYWGRNFQTISNEEDEVVEAFSTSV